MKHIRLLKKRGFEGAVSLSYTHGGANDVDTATTADHSIPSVGLGELELSLVRLKTSGFLPLDNLEISAPASTDGAPPVGLVAPVVCKELCNRIHQSTYTTNPIQDWTIMENNIHFLMVEAGYPQEAQVFFCLWKDFFPQRLQSSCWCV